MLRSLSVISWGRIDYRHHSGHHLLLCDLYFNHKPICNFCFTSFRFYNRIVCLCFVCQAGRFNGFSTTPDHSCLHGIWRFFTPLFLAKIFPFLNAGLLPISYSRWKISLIIFQTQKFFSFFVCFFCPGVRQVKVEKNWAKNNWTLDFRSRGGRVERARAKLVKQTDERWSKAKMRKKTEKKKKRSDGMDERMQMKKDRRHWIQMLWSRLAGKVTFEMQKKSSALVGRATKEHLFYSFTWQRKRTMTDSARRKRRRRRRRRRKRRRGRWKESGQWSRSKQIWVPTVFLLCLFSPSD